MSVPPIEPRELRAIFAEEDVDSVHREIGSNCLGLALIGVGVALILAVALLLVSAT